MRLITSTLLFNLAFVDIFATLLSVSPAYYLINFSYFASMEVTSKSLIRSLYICCSKQFNCLSCRVKQSALVI